MEEKRLNIPNQENLPGVEQLFPYVLGPDNALPLKVYIIKPYSQSTLTPETSSINSICKWRMTKYLETALKTFLRNTLAVALRPILPFCKF